MAPAPPIMELKSMLPKPSIPPMPPIMPPMPSTSNPSTSSSSSSFHLLQSHLTKLSLAPSWSLSHQPASFFFRKKGTSRFWANLDSSLFNSLKNLISHAYFFPSGFWQEK